MISVDYNIKNSTCSDNSSPSGTVALSPQQKRLAAGGLARLVCYKDFIVGNKGWFFLLAFEAYNLFISGLGSMLGMLLRMLLLPCFLKHYGKGTVIGKNVVIRQPHCISLGRSVTIDDSAVLDIRSGDITEQGSEITLGSHVLVGRNTIISTKGGRIFLAEGVNISTDCRIATHTSLEIGESVLIAAYVYIGCGNHRFTDRDTPIIEQDMDIRGGVTIGAHSWIGTKATILDGVTVGRNAVIGAHSLVRENVPDNAIVAGTPARIIRYRS